MNRANRVVVDNRKQAVSIRMNRSDVRHVKRLAERLGVRDSDVIRFAIKAMLARLAPLYDPGAMGRSLVPVFVESGGDLMHHFELDAARLASIINEGADESLRVDPEDIQLIAMTGVPSSYLNLRLERFRREQEIEPVHGVNEANNGATNGSANGNGNGNGHGNGHGAGRGEALGADDLLRQYLYEKYLFARGADAVRARGRGA